MRAIAVIPMAALAAACVTRGPAPPAAPAVTGPMVEEAVRSEPTVAERATLGSESFSARGCAACHTIGGGPLVGPDLAGVTARRDPEWFRSMVTDPDSMLRDDPVARDLHARFGTRMPDLGVAPDEAEALWAFLAVATGSSPFAEAGPVERTCPRAAGGPGVCPNAGGGAGTCRHRRAGPDGPPGPHHVRAGAAGPGHRHGHRAARG